MNVVILWNHAVFLQTRSGWKRGDITRVEDAAEMLAMHLPKRSRIRLIYDPEIMSTELEEVPKGSAKIVSQVLHARKDNAALVSETQAWGFQPQWAGGSAGYLTYLHTETSPGLLTLRESLEQDKQVRIEAAWPLLTPVLDMQSERARAVLTIVHDTTHAYLGGYPASGSRFATKVHATSIAELWTNLSEHMVQAGVPLTDKKLPARIRIFTTAPDGQFEQQCPFWNELKNRNTISVENFDGLAAIVRKLPTGNPSNLIKSLTSDFSLDPGLKGLTAVALAAAVAAGGYFWRDIDAAATQRRALRSQQSLLGSENQRLLSNQQEITNLRLLYGSDVGWSTPGREEFLKALAAAVPSTATATDLNISESGEFSVNGIFWETPDKSTKESLVAPVTLALMKAQPNIVVKSDKTAFEPKSGRFTIAGTINKE